MFSLPSSHAIFDTILIKFLKVLRLFLVFASVNEPPISLTRGSQTQWRFNDGFHFLSTIKACLVILKYNICMTWMRIFWWKYAHVHTRKYTTSWDIQPAFLGYKCCHILQKISLYTSKSGILEEFSNSWCESRIRKQVWVPWPLMTTSVPFKGPAARAAALNFPPSCEFPNKLNSKEIKKQI